jgi:hypothetical protein
MRRSEKSSDRIFVCEKVFSPTRQMKITAFNRFDLKTTAHTLQLAALAKRRLVMIGLFISIDLRAIKFQIEL